MPRKPSVVLSRPFLRTNTNKFVCSWAPLLKESFQRLVPRLDGKGRVPACEVLISNSRIREMIELEERTKEIPTAIAQSYVSVYGHYKPLIKA